MQTQTPSPAPAGRTGGDLEHEVSAAVWLQQEVREGRPLAVAESEILLVALRAAMRRDPARIPQAPGDTGPGFHAVHAVNVAILAMTIADVLRFDEDVVLKVGGAALLHDAGMWLLPLSLLTKREALTDEDRRRIKEHPVEGARLIVAADAALDLAAVVAYEHHVRIDGSGYPHFHYPRAPHYISRLVQVCDVFHALRSPRPFRKPWPMEFVLSFMNERAGFEFHPGLVEALTRAIEIRDPAAAAIAT